MAEFVVAHLLDDCEVGQRFTMWPLHVTILPWFEAANLEEIQDVLNHVASETPSFLAQLGHFSTYGQRLTAQNIVHSPELINLHRKLLRAVEINDWPIKGRYVGSHFSPHVTRKAGRDYGGSTFMIETLQIVESQGQGYRQVVAELALGES